MSPPAPSPRPCVVVTTYARPDSLALLLDDLERELPPGAAEVRVYDDRTPNPDRALAERIRARGWTYRRAAEHHGKRGWWRWWNTILDDLRRSPSRLFYVLQDDMRLCRGFFGRSAELWAAIDDPRKASLHLHVSAERAGVGATCWTPVRAARAGRVLHTGWVDCAAFMCERTLFDRLEWRLDPIDDRRWRGREALSSGVGRQISVRAQRIGLRMYGVERSLTVHDGSPSLMNADARRTWSMDTVSFVDGDAAAQARRRARPPVFASLATIPARRDGLRHVVEALLPQVDSLGVYLNEYDRVPEFLDREEILVARSQEHRVRGDAGKFFWAGTTRGYHLVCDDDVAYPPDYVARLLEGIERYGRRAVVGFHGSVLPDAVADYHVSRRLLHFTRPLAADTGVHVLGTGVAGYHASAIDVGPDDFRAPNMADVQFALLGQRQRVPFVCLRRGRGWLTDLPGFHADSIYVRARRLRSLPGAGPSPETRAVRSHRRWEIHAPPGDERRPHPVETSGRPRRPADTRRPARRLAAPSAPRRPQLPLVRVPVDGPSRPATLVLPDHDHITSIVRRSRTYYERDLLDALRTRASRGVVVDVGAHYGNHTAFFGLECPADVVVAIEPSAQAYAGLLETVAENGLERVVVAHRTAVHPEWRHVAVTPLPWRARRGTDVRSNSGRVGVAPARNGGDAPAAPLDELLDGMEGVTVVKVDAGELGAEVLASGRRVLRRDRPLVAAEAASERARHALRAVLSPLGYREAGRYCWTPTWLWEPVSP